MRDLLVGLAYLIPTALAVAFMVWVFWNFCKQQFRRHRRHSASRLARLTADVPEFRRSEPHRR